MPILQALKKVFRSKPKASSSPDTAPPNDQSGSPSANAIASVAEIVNPTPASVSGHATATTIQASGNTPAPDRQTQPGPSSIRNRGNQSSKTGNAAPNPETVFSYSSPLLTYNRFGFLQENPDASEEYDEIESERRGSNPSLSNSTSPQSQAQPNPRQTSKSKQARRVSGVQQTQDAVSPGDEAEFQDVRKRKNIHRGAQSGNNNNAQSNANNQANVASSSTNNVRSTTASNRNPKPASTQPAPQRGRDDRNGNVQANTQQVNSEQHEAAKKESLKKRETLAVVFDGVHDRFRGVFEFEEELARIAPNIQVRQTAVLERNGFRVDCINTESAEALLRRDNWPTDAFGGNVDVHRSRLYNVLHGIAIKERAYTTAAATDSDNIFEVARKERRLVISYNIPRIMDAKLKELWSPFILDCKSFVSRDANNKVRHGFTLIMRSTEFADTICTNGLRLLVRVVTGFRPGPRVKPPRCTYCQDPDHNRGDCDAPQPKCGFCSGAHLSVNCEFKNDPTKRWCDVCEAHHTRAHYSCKVFQAGVKKLEGEKHKRIVAAKTGNNAWRTSSQVQQAPTSSAVPDLNDARNFPLLASATQQPFDIESIVAAKVAQAIDAKLAPIHEQLRELQINLQALIQSISAASHVAPTVGLSGGEVNGNI